MFLKAGILIVEENIALAEPIAGVLRSEGYLVSGVATSIRDAEIMIRAENVDMVVAGVSEHTPRESLDMVESLLSVRRVPLLYISAFPTRELVRLVKNTVPEAILSRPVHVPDLLAQIELALSKVRRYIAPVVFRDENDDVFVPVVRGYVRIRATEILYILSDSNYCRVYLSPEGLERVLPGKPNTYLHVSVPMGALYHKLPAVFYKLSRFEVINLRKVDSVGKRHLVVGGHEREIPENGRSSLLGHLRIVRRR